MSVSVGPTDSRVEVKIGAIEFVAKDGKQVQAAEGESVAVSAGKAELVTGPRRVLELATIQVTVRADTGQGGGALQGQRPVALGEQGRPEAGRG